MCFSARSSEGRNAACSGELQTTGAAFVLNDKQFKCSLVRRLFGAAEKRRRKRFISLFPFRVNRWAALLLHQRWASSHPCNVGRWGLQAADEVCSPWPRWLKWGWRLRGVSS